MCTEDKESIRSCRSKAMKLLEFSDKSEQQLRERLKEGGFPPFAVDDAIEYLKDLHYLDDRRFADSYIRAKAGQYSASELRARLLEKGISRDDADAAVEAAGLDECAVIRRLFEKRYAGKDLTDPELYRKAFQYFGRKGFGYDNIKNTLTEIIQNS